ncbi:hypothetical protein pb186bvf_002258 [Paramecium bursaria]
MNLNEIIYNQRLLLSFQEHRIQTVLIQRRIFINISSIIDSIFICSHNGHLFKDYFTIHSLSFTIHSLFIHYSFTNPLPQRFLICLQFQRLKINSSCNNLIFIYSKFHIFVE